MSQDTAPASTMTLETLMPLLAEHFLDPRTPRILERDEKFQTLQFRCHQIFYAHDFMDSRLQIPTSISALAARFGCGRDRVKKALAHGLEPPDTPGGHLAMSDDAKKEILSWI
jgi:hypothetical protein